MIELKFSSNSKPKHVVKEKLHSRTTLNFLIQLKILLKCVKFVCIFVYKVLICYFSLKAFLGMQGVLPDGTVIAVKQLSSKSKQGNREFINEIGMISALQHPNLVKLYGCCVEGNQLLLVYEYMENNCVSRALFGKLSTSNYICHFDKFVHGLNQ